MILLITGGTGSLGSTVVKQLLASRQETYDKIVIYSRDEHKQEDLKHVLDSYPNANHVRYLVGDIRDIRRLKFACQDVDHIINAAALKVVMKGESDPLEFIKTNVMGVSNVIEAAIDCGASKVLQVSTDKAVYPINLYGATKLCAEKLMLAANNLQGASGPIFGVVKYGNVEFSNGSVIPHFVKLYKQHQAFTVTDKRMTRFSISLDEAAKFVIGSLRFMTREQNFRVPAMYAYNIMDLCAAIDPEAPIKFIGLREGEKIHESILTIEESSKFPDIPSTSEVAKRLSVQELKERISAYLSR